MKKRTIKLICLVLVFAVVCGVAFTGCRRSDVLERKIYTDNQDVDKDNDTKMNNNDQNNQDEDNDITSRKETDDAKTERNQQETKSTEGDNDNGSTANKNYSASAGANGTAQNSGNGTNQSTDTKSEGVTNTTGTKAGANGTQQTVDPNGKTITIPETSDKIAAVGATAAVVEMLGGSGKLKASSENFVNNSVAKNVFSDLGNVQSLWSGNGSSVISDANFTTLTTLLASDSSGSGAVLYDSGMLSDAQVTALSNAGIKTYPISLATNSTTSYKEQITAIGQILGGDAEKKASQYNSWFDSVLSQAASKEPESKINTLFVQAWDTNTTWSVADRSGTGLGIAPSKKHVVLFDNILSAANITNSVENTAGEMGQARYWYVNPLLGNGAYSVSLNGTVAEVLQDDPLNKLTSVGGSSFLGTSAFPGIITGSASVTTALNNDKNSGSGLWTNYGSITVGNSTAHGFQVGDSIVQTTVYGDYSVNTLPTGAGGSWALGTPECALSAMWAVNKFNNGGLDLNGTLKSFYSTFFGKDLSDSQITSILNGQ